MLTPCLWAQKKELDQARSYVKSGKDLDKAEKLMTDLLKDSVNRQNRKIYAMWFDVVKAQYEAANEKLYLRQKYDTAAFFNLTKHLFDVALRLDTVDTQPDGRGRVRPLYRKSHAAYLDVLRPNLYYGGSYHVRKEEYLKAYDFFDHYLNTVSQPLFSDLHYQRDSVMAQAAYWATYCGFRMGDADLTLKYSELAAKDESKLAFTLQYRCEAYHQQGNDSAYVSTLETGFKAFPESTYFFPRLADYYKAIGNSKKVVRLADYGLGVNDDNTLFLLAKSIALLDMENYDECLEVCERMIQIDSKLAEPYFNCATCYLNEALALESENEPRKNHRRLRELYMLARPYMEDYRSLAPDDSQRWAPALYRIYFNLNMGKQFDEIDQLMRK